MTEPYTKWLLEFRRSGQTIGYVKDIDRDGTFDVILTKEAHKALMFATRSDAQMILDDTSFIHAMGSDHPLVVAEHMFNCGASDD